MQALRSLPSTDEIIRKFSDAGLPHAVVRDQARAVLAAWRERVRAGVACDRADVEAEVEQRLQRLLQPSFRKVINATGIILHTNLGRAPLSNFEAIAGYSNLEYDLATGKRGKRDAHTAALLEALLGKPAIVVNNNAAAVFLVLNELAAGREVLVSRGELIEIGDGFRIPEIMTRSGAILREVGTTNRTRVADYERGIAEDTRLILRVHPSNFHISGFAERPSLAELSELGRHRGILVYEDLGSGCLVNLRGQGVSEPVVRDSFAAGANVVSFSCDKLLGGPQSGIIAGDPELVARIRRNPLYRAFRIDKLIVQALGETLRSLLKQDWEKIPTLRMLFADRESLRARAESIAHRLPELMPRITDAASPIGGGSTPDQALPSFQVRLPVKSAAAFERRLRAAAVPVIARIDHDEIVLDMRTIADEDQDALIASVLSASV